MTVSDQIIGSAFVATAVAVFTYYALWVLVTVRPLPPPPQPLLCALCRQPL